MEWNVPNQGTFHSISVKFLRRHAEALGYKSNFTILDTDDQKKLIRNIVKGDCNYVSIAAASIVAKYIRDNIMIIKNHFFPYYKWDKNKGYGTKDHLLAIKLYGITDFHRKSYNIKVIN